MALFCPKTTVSLIKLTKKYRMVGVVKKKKKEPSYKGQDFQFLVKFKCLG